MNTMVMKMKKNKKGFTLIELIVVIAILAILALIAVPRFAGFTDKGKLAADNQYANIVANSVKVLMADGTITSAGGTINIAQDGTVTGTSFTMKSASPALNFTSEVEKLVSRKTLQGTSRSYTILVAPDGSYAEIGPN